MRTEAPAFPAPEASGTVQLLPFQAAPSPIIHQPTRLLARTTPPSAVVLMGAAKQNAAATERIELRDMALAPNVFGLRGPSVKNRHGRVAQGDTRRTNKGKHPA
jgi:hypothetical protein